MDQITQQGQAALAKLASRHQVSEDAAASLLKAVQAGHGTAAQFNISELGGMGQWSQGGMTQVGDMFNDGLKQKVAALCADLAGLLDDREMFGAGNQPKDHNPDGASKPNRGGNWWPDDLGRPSSTGSQNDMHYALFADAHRLAVQQGGKVTVYDSGDHRITGFAQAQSSGGGGSQTLAFSSQHGTIGTDQLKPVG